MVLTPSVDPEVTCHTGSIKVRVLNLVLQTSVLGREVAQSSLEVPTVLLCPEMTCVSGREMMERTR